MAEASTSSDEMTSIGHDNKTLRIVMLGTTGSGRSTLGNTLLGKKPPKAPFNRQTDGFEIGRGAQSVTMYCKCDTAVRFGTPIEVTDTPGLFHTDLPHEPTQRVLENIVAMTEPGPHIVLFVLRCDHPLTQQVYDQFKQMFSLGMGRFLIVVFNRLDSFEAESLKEKRKMLDEELEDCRFQLTDIIREAEGRYFGIANKASEAEKELQAKELIELMQDLVKRNRGSHYSTEQTQKICKRLEEITMRWALENELSYAAAKPLVKQDVIEGKTPLWENTTQDWCSIS